MRPLVIIVGVLALVVAACASGETEATSAAVRETTTSAQATTTGSAPTTTTTSPPETTETTSGRPLAPDFTLELGDGGSYRLAESGDPVYLVFWAEW